MGLIAQPGGNVSDEYERSNAKFNLHGRDQHEQANSMYGVSHTVGILFVTILETGIVNHEHQYVLYNTTSCQWTSMLDIHSYYIH